MARQEVNQPIKVRVNRAFWLNGEVKNIGDELPLAPSLANELAGAGKVERADLDPSEEHVKRLAEAEAKARAKRKALGPQVSDSAKQLALLTDAVAQLTALVKAQAPSGKAA